jgi:phosphopentomutase
MQAKRAVIMVIDACGVGSLPDYRNYDEIAPSHTLKSTCKYAAEKMGGIKLPILSNLGLSNIDELPGLAPNQAAIGSWGKMQELNDAKDTITGHWEMMGIKALNPFPYYPNGFPDEVINEFKKQAGVSEVLGNCPASGTTIINDFGDEHQISKAPIIYTSADSVLQIAANVEVVPLETLYSWCEIAREIMRGKHEVARIIARPFATNKKYIAGSTKASEMKYIRLGEKRHDYSVLPHSKSVLDLVLENNGNVVGLGKIQDIFARVGVPENIHTDNNEDGLNKLLNLLETKPKSDKEVLFINLVETDSNYGHRRDPEGFAKALEAIDNRMQEVINRITDRDILLISADHGCDPCAVGSDHTREYVPILLYSPTIPAGDLGIRKTFADIGATVLDWFDLPNNGLAISGESLLN